MEASTWAPSDTIALVAILASILVSAGNIWWQSRQESTRAQRSSQELAAARKADRAERLHEHWLDLKRETYVRFITEVDATESAVKARHYMLTGVRDENGQLMPREYPYDLRQAAIDTFRELQLLAPKEIVDAANQFMYRATWYGDNIRVWAGFPLPNSTDDPRYRWVEEIPKNDAGVEKDRSALLNLIREELGFAAIELEPLRTPSPEHTSTPPPPTTVSSD